MSTAASRPVCKSVVVMGVTGSGKTTVAKIIAGAIGADFIDGDDLHSDAARAKMTRGTPLTDEDRWPWLDRVGARLAEGATDGRGVVVACSALKGAYRDRLRAKADVRFVYLKATPDEMKRRVAARKNHFMPPSLVDSQFATLEDPEDEPDVLTMSASSKLPDRALQIAAAL